MCLDAQCLSYFVTATASHTPQMTEVTSWADCMVHDNLHTFVVASVAFVEHWTSDLVETELSVHVSDFWLNSAARLSVQKFDHS